MPRNEKELRDKILSILQQSLKGADLELKPEGRVPYRLPCGTEVTHASDILVSRRGSPKQVSVEIKYKSAVTDQFKCRAYDALHMKREHDDRILLVMLFAKVNKKGISIERAKSFCYTFDRFFGYEAKCFITPDGTRGLVADIRKFFGICR